MKHLKKRGVMLEGKSAKEKNRKHRISDAPVLENDPYTVGEHLNQHKSKKLKTFKEPSKDESVPISLKAVNCGKRDKPQKDAKKSAGGIRRLQLLQANKEEDKVINRLEKILGMNKRRKKEKRRIKKIPSVFAGDGLDFILEVLDKPDSVMQKDIHLNEDFPTHSDSKNSKSFSDCNQKNSVKKTKYAHGSEEYEELFDANNSDSDYSVEESGISDINSEDDVSDDDNKDDDMEVQSTGSIKSHKEDCETSVPDADMMKHKIKKQKPEIWEDIYGRLRDKEGNVLPNPTAPRQMYIPPHERMKQHPVNDERKATLVRIKRQLKGLINRLSESNMNRISNEVEEMYMKNSRNDMNETLMSLLSEVLLSSVSAPPRFAIEQAMLIALLHGNIGSEIGAFFLQSVTLKFDELLKSGRNEEQGKKCNNLLTFLCHLYNFKVTHSLLIFDILQLLMESFQEVDIELILLILKNAGFTLRKDDPLAFKDFLLSVQSKAAALKPGQNQSRVNFMLDILVEVRNNNMEKMKKLLNYDSSITEHLKKVLRGLVHKGNYIQELSISYEDLLKAHERGRWWIVGSAWSEQASESTPAGLEKDHVSTENYLSDKTLLLAKKLRINTETRRIIFNAIVTAQDYLNAFETLIRLKLKNQQEKEIISVLLHCSLQEKNFNPYYAYLAFKFCTYDRRFKGYLKFSLWDKFKELESMKPSQRNCLASLLVHLFTTESMDISILKVIQFSEMNKTMVHFFRKILTALLLHEHEEICCKVFQRIASNSHLHLLRESLKLFMHHFILRRKAQVDHSLAEKLAQRIKIAEDALNSTKHEFKV